LIKEEDKENDVPVVDMDEGDSEAMVDFNISSEEGQLVHTFREFEAQDQNDHREALVNELSGWEIQLDSTDPDQENEPDIEDFDGEDSGSQEEPCFTLSGDAFGVLSEAED
jgi:hypothetical protein